MISDHFNSSGTHPGSQGDAESNREPARLLYGALRWVYKIFYNRSRKNSGQKKNNYGFDLFFFSIEASACEDSALQRPSDKDADEAIFANRS